MNEVKCEEKLEKLITTVVRIDERAKQNKKVIDEMYRRLFGNGQEGIITTMIKHKVYFALLGAGIGLLLGCFIKLMLEL